MFKHGLILWLLLLLSVSWTALETFEQVRDQLGGPVRAARWYGRCVKGEQSTNITYRTNPDGKGYHPARYTYAIRHGNCSDAAQFYYEVLSYHGYQCILMEAWTAKNGHAACVIIINNKMNCITNYGYSQIQVNTVKEVAEYLYPNGRLLGYRVLRRNY